MRCRVNVSIRLKKISIIYDHIDIEKLVINRIKILWEFSFTYISFYISELLIQIFFKWQSNGTTIENFNWVINYDDSFL